MKWARERDLLIAQTMSFVQSVAGKKPETETRAEAQTKAQVEFTSLDEVERVERPVEIVPMTRPSPSAKSPFRLR